ncbi:MAG: PspA/IM30 family protein [Solirubrobacteraceae bacterium]
MRAKIEAFRSRKEVMNAQYSAAEAQVRISEVAHCIGSDMADVGLAMQRAIDKTETMRARANAVQELEAAGTFEDLTAIGPPQDDIDRARAARLGQHGRRGPGAAQGRAGSGARPAPDHGFGGWPTHSRRELRRSGVGVL